jgi:hypothetical protein
MDISSPNFIKALILETHPLQKAKSKLKMQYYIGLEYLIEQCEEKNEYTSARLAQYHDFLVGNATKPKLTDKAREDTIRSVVNSGIRVVPGTFIIESSVLFEYFLRCGLCYSWSIFC